MAKKQKKIKKYRKPLNLNIGMLIFSAIFIYVLVCVIMYFQTSHIVRYEVQEGSLATNNIYRGVIIRDETVVSTEAAGYVNYYAREGERVAKDDLVYIIDETGRLTEELESLSLGENSLSNTELAEFRSEIVDFMHGYESSKFDSTYDFKNSLSNTILKLANSAMLQSISDTGGASGIAGVVSSYSAPTTGIVAYWTDGFEALTPGDVTEAVFDEKQYKKEQYLGNTLMETGAKVYKLSTNENWCMVIPIEGERGAQLEEEGFVKVRFLKNQLESWASTKLLHNGDGNTYLQLNFTNSMVSFISERFLQVELVVNEEVGLKIPNSSIVQKEFFLIPQDYVMEGGERGGTGIMKQIYLEDGTISTEFVNADVYSYDEESQEYYLDASILSAGDILYKPDSQETFTVSKRATLTGVYNMNKGYADFKEILILYQNDEYSIVKANTTYGLNVYDYIVLNSEAVTDDQFIHE